MMLCAGRRAPQPSIPEAAEETDTSSSDDEEVEDLGTPRTGYTEKCDVYSFGITLFELLTGKIPFDKYEDAAILDKIKREKRPHIPSAIAESCPLVLLDTMRDCWQQNPDDRPRFAEVVSRLFAYQPNSDGTQFDVFISYKQSDAPVRNRSQYHV